MSKLEFDWDEINREWVCPKCQGKGEEINRREDCQDNDIADIKCKCGFIERNVLIFENER